MLELHDDEHIRRFYSCTQHATEIKNISKINGNIFDKTHEKNYNINVK